jgi:translation initiation factor IF-2
LAELELIPEDWGGQTMYCETSAKQNIGIDDLLENIQLMAEILELKADPSRKARGRVVEARLDKGRGAVATVLIQDGYPACNGDNFVVGQYSGKVRAMLDDKGRPDQRLPVRQIPVEVQGLSGCSLRPVMNSSWSPTTRWPKTSARSDPCGCVSRNLAGRQQDFSG